MRTVLLHRLRTLWPSLLLAAAGLCLCPTVKAQSLPAHFVQLTWLYTQGTDLAVGFNVYRGTATGGPYIKLTATELPLATLTFQDSTGTGGTKYFYVVTALDISGIESVNSPEAMATFIASSPNAPAGTIATAH